MLFTGRHSEGFSAAIERSWRINPDALKLVCRCSFVRHHLAKVLSKAIAIGSVVGCCHPKNVLAFVSPAGIDNHTFGLHSFQHGILPVGRATGRMPANQKNGGSYCNFKMLQAHSSRLSILSIRSHSSRKERPMP